MQGRGTRGAADRVRLSHGQTRSTLRLALAFIAAAALALSTGVGRWLPIHLFLAGGVVLAISGVSLMLTVTWSAAPAPSQRWVVAQRACIATGAVGIALGREGDLGDAFIVAAAAVYLTGLLVLGWLLTVTVRRGVERRFDPAVVAYVLAIAFGTAGVVLGGWMAAATPTATMRPAHVTVNLLGFVGLVVVGTMPFFAATVGRSRMARHATPSRLIVVSCWQATMVVVAVSGLWTGGETVAAVGLGGYATGVLVTLGHLPRLTRRQLQWAGPRLLAMWAGGIWWTISVAATAVDAASGRYVFGDRWLVALVVAGYAQILWGSLAYLLPMLRGGGHERLTEGFTATRSWVGLAAANAAGIGSFTPAWRAVTGVAIAVWVVDSAWRAVRVGLSRSR